MFDFKKTTLIFLSIIFLCGSSSFSQNKQIDCENAITQMEMNYCAKQSYEKAQKALDKIYNNLVKVIEEKQKDYDNEPQLTGKNLLDLFQDSQNQWIKYKETAAGFNGAIYQGGSMQPLIYYNVLARITEDRIKELKDLLEELSM